MLFTHAHAERRLGALLLAAALGLSSAFSSAASAAAPAQSADPAPLFELEILPTNDTHAFAAGLTDRGAPCDDDEKCFGGYPRIAAAIKAEKAAHPHVLALDAGDRWQGTLFFRTGGPAFIARAGNAVPWDASTLGNHEFDLGLDALARFIDASRAPTLAANLRPKPGTPLGKLPPEKFGADRIFSYGGIKVGVFGLANGETETFAVTPETLSASLDFEQGAETASAAVRSLKQRGADIIIALTHEGYEADQALARAVDGIDVIVGGHTHSLLGEGLPGAEGPYPTVIEKPSGEKTLVFFRADDASLSADDGTGAPVVVKDLHFMGNFVRVSVIPGDGSENELVKVNLQTLPAGIGPGARMRLHVAPERLMAFRA